MKTDRKPKSIAALVAVALLPLLALTTSKDRADVHWLESIWWDMVWVGSHQGGRRLEGMRGEV